MAETSTKKKTSAGNGEISGKVESKEKKVITVDNSIEDVLQLNQDKRVVLIWDHTRFLDLPDSVIDELGKENRDNFYRAKGAYETLVKDVSGDKSEEALITHSPLMDTIGYYSHQTELRERRGYHQCWKRPDEVEYAKSAGYTVVRELSDEQKKGNKAVKPGEENGEIRKLKRSTRTGKVVDELVGMEIPQDVYDRHEKAVGAMSKQRFKGVQDVFKEEAEKLNRKYGGNGRTITAVDRS